jgi:hypothetical protein
MRKPSARYREGLQEDLRQADEAAAYLNAALEEGSQEAFLLALRDVAEAISRQGRGRAVVGGIAVSARSEPRFTRDVDLAVAIDNDAEAEALVHALLGGGYSVVEKPGSPGRHPVLTSRSGS